MAKQLHATEKVAPTDSHRMAKAKRRLTSG
jgi:hypothetical protein